MTRMLPNVRQWVASTTRAAETWYNFYPSTLSGWLRASPCGKEELLRAIMNGWFSG